MENDLKPGIGKLVNSDQKEIDSLFNPGKKSEFRNNVDAFNNEEENTLPTDIYKRPLQTSIQKINNEKINNNEGKKSITRFLRKFIKNKDIKANQLMKFYFMKWENQNDKKYEKIKYKKIIKVRIEYSKNKSHSVNPERKIVSSKLGYKGEDGKKDKHEINVSFGKEKRDEKLLSAVEIKLSQKNNEKDKKKELQKIQEVYEKKKVKKIQEISEKYQTQENKEIKKNKEKAKKQDSIESKKNQEIKKNGENKENRKNQIKKEDNENIRLYEIKENKNKNKFKDYQENKEIEKDKGEVIKNNDKFDIVFKIKRNRQKMNQNIKNKEVLENKGRNESNNNILENKRKIEYKEPELVINKEKGKLKNKKTLNKNVVENKAENKEEIKNIKNAKIIYKNKKTENPPIFANSQLKMILPDDKNINYKKMNKNTNADDNLKNQEKSNSNLTKYKTKKRIKKTIKPTPEINIEIHKHIKEYTRNPNIIISSRAACMESLESCPIPINVDNLNNSSHANVLYHNIYRNNNNSNNNKNNYNIYIRSLDHVRNNSYNVNSFQFSNNSKVNKDFNVKDLKTINKKKLNIYNRFINNIPFCSFDLYDNKIMKHNYQIDLKLRGRTSQNNPSNIRDHVLISNRAAKETFDNGNLTKTNNTVNQNITKNITINLFNNKIKGNNSYNYEDNRYRFCSNTSNNFNRNDSYDKNKNSMEFGKITVIQHYKGMKKVIDHYEENSGKYLNRTSSGQRLIFKKINSYSDFSD